MGVVGSGSGDGGITRGTLGTGAVDGANATLGGARGSGSGAIGIGSGVIGGGGATAWPRILATSANAFRIGGPKERGAAVGEAADDCRRCSMSSAVCFR